MFSGEPGRQGSRPEVSGPLCDDVQGLREFVGQGKVGMAGKVVWNRSPWEV